ELEKAGMLDCGVPVDPGDLVVLAVTVVVAALGAPEFVAGEQHRNALAEKERDEEVPHLPVAQGRDPRILRRALSAAIPRPVVVGAVSVLLAVGFVVLAVVA